jgi:hypothetical protein
MKKILLGIVIIAGVASGATYVGSVSNVWPSYATTVYVDGVAAGLQADIDALTPSNAFTGLIINGMEYNPAVGGTVTVTQQLAQIDGGNVTDFAADKVQFDTTVTNVLAEGEVGWNVEDGTVAIGRANGGSTDVGQEMVFPTRNESGAGITNGWVVYQTGFSGNRPLIDVHNGGHAPFGICTHAGGIDDNSNGDVATVGYVRGVDTSSYELNAELYASTNGPAVTNRPAYPTDAFQVGRVAKVHATEGVILAQTPTCSKSWSELDAQYKFDRAYGSMYIHDNSDALNITTAETYYVISGWTTSVVENCTMTSSNITVLVDGAYKLSQSVSFSGVGNATYECAFFVNTNHLDCGEFERKLGVAGDVGSAASSCITRLSSNDVVTLRIEGSNTGNLVVRQATVHLEKIDD